MSEKDKRMFHYLSNENYDAKVKINGENLNAFSAKKLEELYAEDERKILGETYENRKRNANNDIGRIELNEKILYVTEKDNHSKLFKTEGAYIQVSGGFISLLKTRLIAVIIIIALLLGGLAAGLYIILHDDGPDIKPIPSTLLTISGTVKAGDKAVEDASLSLMSGNTEISTATTDSDGKYLFSDVKNGFYNLVCKSGNSTLTKPALIIGESLILDFSFPADKSTAINLFIEITGDDTPAVTVSGLDKELEGNMVSGKDTTLTFTVTKQDESAVSSEDVEAIKTISGETKVTWLDFSLLKEIFANNTLESSEYIRQTSNVLEIVVPYDSSRSAGTYVFRYHDGKAEKFTQLENKPVDNFTDGTCYVAYDRVYIYADKFSTYAIGAAFTDHVIRGSDTITYSSYATVNLKTKKISMLYEHSDDSTHSAIVQLYLVGEKDNLLIAESEIIPVGYKIESMNLNDNTSKMPSVGTYEGIMRIIYVGDDNQKTSTQVDTQIEISITQ